MKINLTKIKESKAIKLCKIACKLEEISPIDKKEIKLSPNDIIPSKVPNGLIAELTEWEKSQDSIYIYYFYLNDNADLESVYEKILNARNNKKGRRAYPRINKPSKFLYVGSSRKITNRFKGHLGYGYKGTFAMNLAYWFNLNSEIIFYCMAFPSGIDRAVIQALEDGLWESLKPLLGRKGPR